MVDDKGNKLKEALPSQPVEILGLSDVPNAGEVFLGHETDKEAKQYANTYLSKRHSGKSPFLIDKPRLFRISAQ